MSTRQLFVEPVDGTRNTTNVEKEFESSSLNTNTGKLGKEGETRP